MTGHDCDHMTPLGYQVCENKDAGSSASGAPDNRQQGVLVLFGCS